jgi:hypothetical protein
VLGHQTARRFEIQHRAIQRATAALDHTENEAGASARRQACQRLRFRAWHIDRIIKITREGFATFRQPITQLRAECLTFGIATQQRLGHYH